MILNFRFWFGLAVSIAFIFLLFHRVNLHEVQDALMAANYLHLIPAIALYFCAVFFRAIRWKYILHPIRTFRISRLYPVIVVGYMANNLLPVRLGELVRAYYLGKRERFSMSTTFATIVIERIYDGIALIVLGSLTIPVLWATGALWDFSSDGVHLWVILATVLCLTFAILIFLLSLIANPNLSQDFIESVLARFPNTICEKVRSATSNFISGLQILRKRERHFGVFALSLPIWIFEAATYYTIGISFKLPSAFSEPSIFLAVSILITATSNLATSIPSTMGGIGPFEYVAQRTLVFIGIQAPLATAYVTFLHIVVLLVPVTLLGLFILWKENMSLSRITRQTYEEEVKDLT